MILIKNLSFYINNYTITKTILINSTTHNNLDKMAIIDTKNTDRPEHYLSK